MSGYGEVIFTVISVIITGLLFIDLVPLQEPMICHGNYTNATLCPEVFYSSSYQQARERFLAAAAAAHAEVAQHLIFEKGNVRYYMDSAFLKGKRSDKLLVHSSGTQGVSGYTGSAIQVKLLQEWDVNASKGPSVLFVHAVNPYGMAHYRRANEENVELCRNHLTANEWAAVRTRDPNLAGYEDLRSVLVWDTPPRFIHRYVFFFSVAKAVAQHGLRSIGRTLSASQYHDPEGLSFGGLTEQWSITVFRALLTRYAVRSGAASTVFLDVDTGFGSAGIDTLTVLDKAEETRCQMVFPGSRTRILAPAATELSSGSAATTEVLRPTNELGPNTLAVTQTFGTVKGLFVARALILENAAYRLCRNSYVHTVMQSWMRDAFYPQEISFKRETLNRGTAAFRRAWTFLNETHE